MEPVAIDTSLATIERSSASLVEIRIKPDEVMSGERIRDLYAPLDTHGLAQPERLLVVLPSSGLQFDVRVFYRDHYADRPADRSGHAMALVASDSTDRKLLSIYFKYFPSPQQSKVFGCETEAREWLLSF